MENGEYDAVDFQVEDLSPAEMAEYVYASGDLIFNPYESGSLEFKQFIDRLLDLTSGEGE